MAVLLIADVTVGWLATTSVAKALTAVAGLGPVDVLVVGPAAEAAEAANLSGVAKVLHAEDEGHGLAEPVAALAVSLAVGYSHIAGAATAFNKNILPRVATLLDVMVIPDVTAEIDAETFERPIYAGNAIQTVKSGDVTKVFSVRTAAFAAAAVDGSAPVVPVALIDPGLSVWVADRVAASDRPDLSSAGIVVSGGRGVGSTENSGPATSAPI